MTKAGLLGYACAMRKRAAGPIHKIEWTQAMADENANAATHDIAPYDVDDNGKLSPDELEAMYARYKHSVAGNALASALMSGLLSGGGTLLLNRGQAPERALGAGVVGGGLGAFLAGTSAHDYNKNLRRSLEALS